MKRWVKWTVFAVAFAVILLFGIESVPISDRAIVIGLAVDREEDAYMVSAQILMASSGQDQSTSSGVVSVEYPTLSGALNEISKQTGMLVTLSHCNLVILGPSVLDGYAQKTLDYLSRNAYLSENALLVTSESSAREVLSAKGAYAQTTAFFMQQPLISDGQYQDIVYRTIKEYRADFSTFNGANRLPVVRPVPAEPPMESGGQGGGGEDPAYVFDLSQTAILIKEQYVFTANRTETAGLNYAEPEIQRGGLYLEGDAGESIELYIAKGGCKRKYDADTLTATFDISLRIILKEIISPEGEERPVATCSLSASEDQRLKQTIADSVLQIFNRAAEAGADVFELYEGFYADDPKGFPAKAGDYLTKARLNVNVELKYE